MKGGVGLILTFTLNINFYLSIHIELSAELFKLSDNKIFYKQIYNLIIYPVVSYFNFILQDIFPNEVIVHLHMLSSCMENFIFRQVDHQLIIAIKWYYVIY